MDLLAVDVGGCPVATGTSVLTLITSRQGNNNDYCHYLE